MQVNPYYWNLSPREKANLLSLTSSQNLFHVFSHVSWVKTNRFMLSARHLGIITDTVLHSFEQISHQILQAPFNSALFPLRLHLYWHSWVLTGSTTSPSDLPVHNFLNNTEDCTPLLTPELVSRIAEREQRKQMAEKRRKDRRWATELCGEYDHICRSFGLWTFSLGPGKSIIRFTTEERH